MHKTFAMLPGSISVERAAELLAEVSGATFLDCEAALIEAIESGAIPARVVHWLITDYENGDRDGAINTKATKIEKEDLQYWFDKRDADDPNARESGTEAGPELAPEPTPDALINTTNDASSEPVKESRAADAGHTKPLLSQQEDLILEALKALKYTPGSLPKTNPGKSGPKKAVREWLYSRSPQWTDKKFDKAWERLRNDGRIVNTDGNEGGTSTLP